MIVIRRYGVSSFRMISFSIKYAFVTCSFRTVKEPLCGPLLWQCLHGHKLLEARPWHGAGDAHVHGTRAETTGKSFCWVAVKELKLSYHNSETALFTIDPPYGNFNQAP